MSLEQAIHQRWAQTDALAAMLPAERVTTGRAVGAARPYATLMCLARRPILHANTGDQIDEVRLRIRLWHDDYDAGLAIVEQIRAAFDRSRFAIDENHRVVHMRRVGDTLVERGDGVWQWSVRFLVQVSASLPVE